MSVVQWQTRLEPVLFVPSAVPKLGKTARKAVGDTQLSTGAEFAHTFGEWEMWEHGAGRGTG